VAAALAPRPVRLEGLVDGLNRRVTAADLARTYDPTRVAYRAAGGGGRFTVDVEPASAEEIAHWLLAQTQGEVRQPSRKDEGGSRGFCLLLHPSSFILPIRNCSPSWPALPG